MEGSVQTVTLIARNAELAAARANIEKWSDALGLRLVAIDQKPRRFTTQLVVKLSGDAKQIGRFRAECGGDGFDAGVHNPQDIPVAWVLWWVSRKMEGRRRRRSARNVPS